ncbi:hypothetical protein ACOSQ4_000015 [Xanthoceras sorbifolium]
MLDWISCLDMILGYFCLLAELTWSCSSVFTNLDACSATVFRQGKGKINHNPFNSKANAKCGLENPSKRDISKFIWLGKISFSPTCSNPEESTIRQWHFPRHKTYVDKDKFSAGRICCSQLKNRDKVRYSE